MRTRPSASSNGIVLNPLAAEHVEVQERRNTRSRARRFRSRAACLQDSRRPARRAIRRMDDPNGYPVGSYCRLVCRALPRPVYLRGMLRQMLVAPLFCCRVRRHERWRSRTRRQRRRPPRLRRLHPRQRAQRSVRIDPLDRQSADDYDRRMHGANRTLRHRKRLHEHDDDRNRAAAATELSAVAHSLRNRRSALRSRVRAAELRNDVGRRTARHRLERRRTSAQNTNSATRRTPLWGVNGLITFPTGAPAFTAGNAQYTGNFNWAYTVNSSLGLAGRSASTRSSGFNSPAAPRNRTSPSCRASSDRGAARGRRRSSPSMPTFQPGRAGLGGKSFVRFRLYSRLRAATCSSTSSTASRRPRSTAKSSITSAPASRS